MKSALLIASAALLSASCSSAAPSQATVSVVTAAATSIEPVTGSSASVPVATTVAGSTTAAAPTTTTSPAMSPATTIAPTIAPTSSTAQPVVSLPPSTVAETVRATVPPTAANVSDGTAYGLPIEPGVHLGYAREHHDYPASDIFAGDCGTTVVSPVNGTLLEVRRENLWTADTDNPATRGGKSVSLLGDDGVRYYFAHFDQIQDGLAPGARVAIGDHFGQIGRTGRAGACHLHFALSPPCPGKEWSVRRGVVWPWPYLDAWRQGEQLSPADEVAQWSRDHPDACAEAMADPFAADS